MTRRGRRALIALLVTLSVAVGLVVSVRWLLGPDNLARIISAWVEREWQASLTLRESPGVRLIPRLQLSLRGVDLTRDGQSIATAEELNIALPWSTLWTGSLNVESLGLRRPVVNWPQLARLIADQSDPTAGPRAPRLPQIEVGLRIEEGELYSGADDEAWRLDRVSLVTTPLIDNQPFHLDAGARLRGRQSRMLSLTVRTVPRSHPRELELDELGIRLVVSPDQMPLSDGVVLNLQGMLLLDPRGLARVDLDGGVPSWPDWLPNVLDFDPDQPAELTVRWLENAHSLVASLGQGQHILDARLDGRDLNAAVGKIGEPLAALAALRGQWRLETLQIGDFQFQGIELNVTPASTPDDEVDPDSSD